MEPSIIQEAFASAATLLVGAGLGSLATLVTFNGDSHSQKIISGSMTILLRFLPMDDRLFFTGYAIPPAAGSWLLFHYAIGVNGVKSGLASPYKFAMDLFWRTMAIAAPLLAVRLICKK